MIRVTGLYRNNPDSKFDFNYYLNTHMPLVKKRMEEFGMGEFEIERGMEAADGGVAPYICITHMEFTTLDDFRAGLEKHGVSFLQMCQTIQISHPKFSSARS